MSWIEKWRIFCARRYIKNLKKHLPYVDLKSELSVETPELPLEIVERLIRNDSSIMQNVLEQIFDMDRKLAIHVFVDLLSANVSDYENIIKTLLEKKHSVAEEIVLWFLTQNPDCKHSLILNDLMENGATYFHVPDIRKLVIKEFQNDRQALLEALSDNNANQESVIKELMQTSPSFREFIICTVQTNSTFLFGGISHCIYNPEKQILKIDGWYLPKYKYDTIAVYLNGDLLGMAACGIKRIDVFQNYPVFNEKYAGFQLTVKYEKYITETDVIEIHVFKDKNLVRQTRKNIIFSNNDLGGIINSDNTPENKLEIIHNNQLVDFINLNEFKNIQNLFYPLDHAIRTKKETGWKLRSISNHLLKKEVSLKPHPRCPAIFDGYDELIENVTENVEFYKTYLLYNNYNRVYEDYKFIQKYISSNSNILDIGAVPPLLESMLIKEKYRTLTILDPNAVHFSSYFKKHNIKYINSDIFSITNEEITQTYDFVIFTEVLEHLSGNLLEILSKLNAYVANGGYLYITTPNLKSISGLYGLCIYSSGLASKYRDTVMAQHKRYVENGYWGHLREYTAKEVIDLLSNFGFKLVEQRCFPEYRNENSLVIALEELYPEWGIWGKYLFKKIEI